MLFFNTAAFSIPAPGTFGNAGRNIIIGPGSSVMNLGLTRNLTWGQTRGLSIQVLASNLFNDVQFASIDTNINSPTFGRVTSVRPMRRVQIPRPDSGSERDERRLLAKTNRLSASTYFDGSCDASHPPPRASISSTLAVSLARQDVELLPLALEQRGLRTQSPAR